ncbi:MAG: RdgB/HAM1 family non-canonical purine NTP pyrophosphatase [Candidatus Sericytochromatia bacterium]|nr:RdgB/HAM1 family non-canonical purine NTP pyrophosphatase [Candidatus Sericytochromatia bacterium]
MSPTNGPFYVATTNAHKVEELQALFGDAVSVQPAPAGYAAPDEDEPTYTGNARLKAEALVRQFGFPALADDSGLEVDALDGAPGLHTARWADTPEARLQKLEQGLSGVAPAQRGARFVCALVAVWPDGTSTTVEATVDGRIATERRGVGGFGYDPLFELPELGRTMAELSAVEKNHFSHRARAVRALLDAWALPVAPA